MIACEPQQLLFAAGEIWEALIAGLFFIIWTVAQLLGSREEAKRKKKVARQRPRQPEPIELVEVPPQGKKQGPRDQAEALRSEVEEFLRRAQGKPAEPKAAKPTRPVAKTPPKRTSPERVAPAASMAAPKTLRSEGVAEHVARHLSTEDIATHTKGLGAKVATADDRLESHLHEKFDHQLGSLQHRESAEQAKSENTDLAAEIAAMLSNPQGMRQLVVANEILRRPEW